MWFFSCFFFLKISEHLCPVFHFSDWGESCWHGSELGLSVGTVSKVCIVFSLLSLVWTFCPYVLN